MRELLGGALIAALAAALSACGPARPEASSLRACDDVFFFGNHITVSGTVPATNECAFLALVDRGDDHVSELLELPKGWDVERALITPGDCEDPSGDSAPAGSVKGSVRLHDRFLSDARNVELDVELARGPFADPPSVYLAGSVDAESALCGLEL